MKKLKVLDLFSGIGGFSLGLHRAGMETVAFCEKDEFCQKVLAKNFPNFPIHDDITTLNKDFLHDKHIDIICGGFPCQPFSNAGKKKGRQDDRDLWPEMFRVIKETKPTWVIGENVAGFIGMEFTRTKINLESIGYSVQPFIIPACAVGTQHRRDRVWIIAHLDSEQLRKQSIEFSECENQRLSGHNGEEKPTSNLDCQRLEIQRAKFISAGSARISETIASFASNFNSDGLGGETNAPKKENNKGIRKGNWWPETSTDFGNWWTDQSGMGRAVYGFSNGVDRFRRHRVKALGNAIVPRVAEIIGRAIVEVEDAIL